MLTEKLYLCGGILLINDAFGCQSSMKCVTKKWMQWLALSAKIGCPRGVDFTSCEKAYEDFYLFGEKIDMNRLAVLAVVFRHQDMIWRR